MKKARKAPVTRKALIRRTILIIIVFLFAGSISYPQGANWLIDRYNGFVGERLQVSHIDFPTVLGLDLQGGTHLDYVADLTNVPEADRSSAMDGVRDVIERRVNQMGVSEPLVQNTRAGDQYRLTVELAGVRDVNEAIRMIGETPILEFREENPDAGRDLTEDERKELETMNEEVRTRAQAALARVESGESIETVARELSEDPVSKERGGDLGWLVEQRAYPKLQEAFQGKEPGTKSEGLIDDGEALYIAELIESRDAGEEIRASHILVQFNTAIQSGSTSTEEQARAKIEEIASRLTSENFDSIAAAESEEPGANNTKGDLEWFRRGDMVEPFDQAAFGLAVGEISGIVRTDFGFHIIKKTDQRKLSDVHVRSVIFMKKMASDVMNSEPFVRTELTGKHLKRSILDFDPQTGMPQVTLEFDAEGTRLFADITRRNIGKQVAIYLDGSPISIPTVQQEIPSGQAVISGSSSIDEAKLLSQRLQAGALPVPISLVAQQSIGPVLGAESIGKSLQAGIVGLLLVAVFMILFYRLPGLVSVLSLIFYAAIVIATFKLIPVTLTLSGIAGFILSIGIAVDANVLIFARLREEFAQGKTPLVAIEDAFSRAWLSIRDGNATTIIVCVILYAFTSSLIKGFALTLTIGVLYSMISAIVVTRTFLKLLAMTPLIRWVPWLFLIPRNK